MHRGDHRKNATHFYDNLSEFSDFPEEDKPNSEQV